MRCFRVIFLDFKPFLKIECIGRNKPLQDCLKLRFFGASCFLSFLPSYFQIKNVQNRKFGLYFVSPFCA